MIQLLMALPLATLSQQPAASKKLSDGWKEHYAASAAALELAVRRDGKLHPLQLKKESILRYTNPERERGQHGAVFVWTDQGRPEVVGTLWSIRFRGDPNKRRTALELHTTSQHRLTFAYPADAVRKNGKVPEWNPPSPGIEFTQVAAEKPASTHAGRLLQLKRLARQFSGTLTSTDGSRESLRLLPRPIYRYRSEATGVVDGAMFAMVMGTDPELIVVLELRRKDDTMAWYYAPVRFTGRPLQLSLDKKVVWQTEKATTWDAAQSYLFCIGVNEVNADAIAEKQ